LSNLSNRILDEDLRSVFNVGLQHTPRGIESHDRPERASYNHAEEKILAPHGNILEGKYWVEAVKRPVMGINLIEYGLHTSLRSSLVGLDVVVCLLLRLEGPLYLP